jgi:hypothetical protein
VPANNNPTYEILSSTGISSGGSIKMGILDNNQPYYMYPFMHLLKDGRLYIFTDKASQIFNIESNSVVKTLPNLPGDHRTYPNTGGSVLLPLSSSNGWASKVMICGGGAYQVRRAIEYHSRSCSITHRTSPHQPSPAAVSSLPRLPTLPGKWTPCPKAAAW